MLLLSFYYSHFTSKKTEKVAQGHVACEEWRQDSNTGSPSSRACVVDLPNCTASLQHPVGLKPAHQELYLQLPVSQVNTLSPRG